MMNLKISLKILLAFLFIIILMSLLSVYLINISSDSLQYSIGNISILLANEMMERIDYNIYSRIEELRRYINNLARMKSFMEYLIHMNTVDVLTAYKEDPSFPDTLIQNNITAMFRTNLILSYEYQYSYKIFSNIILTNKNGITIAQTSATTDVTQTNKEWWILTKNNNLYISDIKYDYDSQTYGLSICIRIDDEDGEFAGIVKALLSIKGIIMEAELNIKEYKNFEATLATGDGKVIYSSKAFHYLSDISYKKYYKYLKDKEKIFMVEEGGRNRLFTHTHSKGYRNYKGHNWVLIIAQDLNEVFEPISTLIMRMIIVSLVIIVLGIFISYIISRSISKPVEKLIKAVKIIGNGDLDYKVKISTQDEINELAAAFNIMTIKLKKTISDIKKAENEITKSLKEKEILLQELHHRVKNNLQVIMSMLRLQSETIKEGTYKNKFREIQNKINSISLVHEQLYRSEDLMNINIALYIQTIINNLFRFYNTDPGKIRLNLEIEEILIGLDQAIPCGLIINELISNSLKYAFPGQKSGTISIALHSREDNEIMLLVSDNGILILNELDHFRNSESLGLYLVIILTEDQLNGTITLERENGNTFRIIFKKEGL